MAYPIDDAIDLADKICDEFDRLEVSTNQDAYSGVMAVETSSFSESNPDLLVVRVLDDNTDGVYDAVKLLDKLRSCEGEVGIHPEAEVNIWDFMRDCEV